MDKLPYLKSYSNLSMASPFVLLREGLLERSEGRNLRDCYFCWRYKK